MSRSRAKVKRSSRALSLLRFNKNIWDMKGSAMYIRLWEISHYLGSAKLVRDANKNAIDIALQHRLKLCVQNQ